MAIYGIGAYYGEDVSADFINASLVGVGWSKDEAPELHEFIGKLKPGDIVYIKSFPPRSENMTVKAVGIITSEEVLNAQSTNGLVEAGRRVSWLDTGEFTIQKPAEKNNVRRNTLYEEHHPLVRRAILERFISRLRPARA